MNSKLSIPSAIAVAVVGILLAAALVMGGGKATATGCANTNAATPIPATNTVTATLAFASNCFTLSNGSIQNANVAVLMNQTRSVNIVVKTSLNGHGGPNLTLPAGTMAVTQTIPLHNGDQLQIMELSSDCAANCPPNGLQIVIGDPNQAQIVADTPPTPVATCTSYPSGPCTGGDPTPQPVTPPFGCKPGFTCLGLPMIRR